ncbi:MAG: hypothetical protein ABI903_05780 [Actinomycetota bacterium]
MAGVLLFLGTVTQSPAQFVWDAADYWAGAASLASGGDPFSQHGMSVRGVWSAVLYLPAALAARVFGASTAAVAVLVENSLLISVVGVLLLPLLLRAWGPVTPRMVWVCTGLTWVVVGRFAPYPLTDVWAAALILAAVLALQRRPAMSLLGAGLLAGIAFNVRPAYLVPVLLVLVVVILRRRLAGGLFVVGVVLAQVPQSLVNLMHGVGWKPWPPGMVGLTQLQAYYASYVVRYDTGAANVPGLAPRQIFCDPAMAVAIGDHPPDSAGSQVLFYLHNLPQSLVFLAEKAAAVLHWPPSAPYFAPTWAGEQVIALLVTTVAVMGVASLVYTGFRSGIRSAPLAIWAALLVWLGSLATILLSAPETRFAMPLVLLGIAGCAALAGRWPGNRRVASAAIAIVVVFAIGTAGLSHPAAPGEVSPAACEVS